MKPFRHLATVTGLIVCLATALLATAGDEPRPKIVFDNTPESGVPREARNQAPGENDRPTTVPKLLGDSLTTVHVHYFDTKTWKNQQQVSQYIAGLIADPDTGAYTRQGWSQTVAVPEIECLLTFKDRTEGRLLLWRTVGCLRDGNGNWWFISAVDYFHRKHPLGDRTWVHPVKPSE